MGVAEPDRHPSRTADRLETAAGRHLVGRIRPTSLADEQVLPVLDGFDTFLPAGGLRRGTTVAVGGRGGAVSLALALVAGASAAGSWTASVGLGGLGLVAASGTGIALDRLAVVARPPDVGSWASTVATLVEAFDVVLFRAPRRVPPGQARRLAGRVRERGAVLVQVSGDRRDGLEADLRLTVTRSRWLGLDEGSGHLRARRVTVESGGRRDASRPRRVELWLPAPDGRPVWPVTDRETASDDAVSSRPLAGTGSPSEAVVSAG